MYIVQAKVNGVRIPLFYLNEDIQEIADCKHAEKIANDVLNPLKEENKLVWVYAEKVNQ